MINTANFSIEEYEFDAALNREVVSNRFAKDQWPVVYILSDGAKKVAYVGETTDTLSRMKAHLGHNEKRKLTAVHLISSDQFNKSVTLDIESNLIKYIAADQQYQLLNANLGIANHNYCQKTKYWDLFTFVWSDLRKRGLAKRSLGYIENLNLFKYSPYKSLSPEQNDGLLNILRSLANDTHENTLVQGGAGTGKSILAIFLFKLLVTSTEDLNFQEFGDNEMEVIDLVEQIKFKKPDLKMALVIPMSSFRKTLQKVFRQINGLSADMVIGPSALANSFYDLVLVDEAHRLKQRVNLGNYPNFDKPSEKLGFDKFRHTQLDWVLQQSDRAVFFYDANQSIKPSDVPQESFDKLMNRPTTKVQHLRSQFRVQAGNDYTDFVDKLLNVRLGDNAERFSHKNYELKLFSSLEQMVSEIKRCNQEEGLSRLIAGFSWPWVSKLRKNNPKWREYDIDEDGVTLKWNTTDKDWINTEGCENEVGCIHTTQGYDLNYTGIIFGHEITFDPVSQQIIIVKENYHDQNGKRTILDKPQRLLDYIVNIYKTIMLRGIKGTYIYVCDAALREYMARHIPLAESKKSREAVVRQLSPDVVKPYINIVPLYNLTAAAGAFSEVQQVENVNWVAIPPRVTPSEDLFACRVIGESMNRVIPNGSICLFRRYQGGSRNGKIMLVELSKFTDRDTGSAYTVKEYRSQKVVTQEGYSHRSITLLPQSDDDSYKKIEVSAEMAREMRTLAEFEMVLGENE